MGRDTAEPSGSGDWVAKMREGGRRMEEGLEEKKAGLCPDA